MEQRLRFKPGDKVIIDPDLNIHTRYQALTGRNAGWGIAPSLCMTLLAGQEFEVRSYSYSQKTLKLKGLPNRLYWGTTISFGSSKKLSLKYCTR